jgi:uncharacterized protein (DUF2147 family)
MNRGANMDVRSLVRVAVGLAVLWSCAGAQAAVRGRWINPSKSVIIEITPCGEVLCGTVVWASEKAKRDARKGTHHLVGTRLLTGMKHSSAHVWKGRIFVPDHNMHASAKLRPEGGTHLKVSGCVMMICKSQTWTKTHLSQG